jgi:hypothetical protein
MVRQVLFNSGATYQERQTRQVRQSSHAVSYFGLRVLLILGLLCTLNSGETLSAEAQPTTLPEVTVRGTTPLMSVPLPEKDIPVNVQVATEDDYRSSGALNLTDFLARDLAGVSLTQVQNNPFQPDVLYRGFTSSFLVGTPPGLSVFVDGVRVNEPLADQVNWDLIPADAIELLGLIPGSNPLADLCEQSFDRQWPVTGEPPRPRSFGGVHASGSFLARTHIAQWTISTGSRVGIFFGSQCVWTAP